MAITSVYNIAPSQISSTGFNAGSDLKVLLLSGDASFSATNTNIDQVTATGSYELFGYGWDEGGVPITGLSSDVVNINESRLNSSDVEVIIVGGTLGPVYSYCIYNNTNKIPLCFVQLSSPVEIDSYDTIAIPFSVSGLYTLAISGV